MTVVNLFMCVGGWRTGVRRTLQIPQKGIPRLLSTDKTVETRPLYNPNICASPGPNPRCCRCCAAAVAAAVLLFLAKGSKLPLVKTSGVVAFAITGWSDAYADGSVVSFWRLIVTVSLVVSTSGPGEHLLVQQYERNDDLPLWGLFPFPC